MTSSKRKRSEGEDQQSKKQKTNESGTHKSDTIEKQIATASNVKLTLDTPGITKEQREKLLRAKRTEARKAKKVMKKEAKKIKAERAREIKKLTKNTDKYDKEKRKQNKLLKNEKKLQHNNNRQQATVQDYEDESQPVSHSPQKIRQPSHNSSNYGRVSHLFEKATEFGMTSHEAMLIDKLAFAVAKLPKPEQLNHTYPMHPSIEKPGPASNWYMERIRYHDGKSLNPAALFNGFFFGRIPQVITQCYASAGIIPYCKKKTRCYMLLGLEDRSHKRDGGVVWSYFGGKKMRGENPVDTAIREFSEETLHCFQSSQQLSRKFLQAKLTNCDDRFPYWCKDGRAVLFFMRVDYDSSIPETFQQARQKQIEEGNNLNCDQLEIGWIRTSKVLKAVRNQQPLFPEQNIMRYFGNIVREESMQLVLDSKFELLEQL